MQRNLKKALFRAFDRVLAKRLQQFVPVNDTTVSGIGCRLYRAQLTPQVFAFILIVTHSQRNEFTVELAWSGNDQFPVNSPCKVPTPIARCGIRADDMTQGEFRFRPALLAESPRDVWW